MVPTPGHTEGTHSGFPCFCICFLFPFQSICTYRSNNINMISAESTSIQISQLFHNSCDAFCHSDISALSSPFLQTSTADFNIQVMYFKHITKMFTCCISTLFCSTIAVSGAGKKKRRNVYISCGRIKCHIVK